MFVVPSPMEFSPVSDNSDESGSPNSLSGLKTHEIKLILDAFGVDPQEILRARRRVDLLQLVHQHGVTQAPDKWTLEKIASKEWGGAELLVQQSYYDGVKRRKPSPPRKPKAPKSPIAAAMTAMTARCKEVERLQHEGSPASTARKPAGSRVTARAKTTREYLALRRATARAPTDCHKYSPPQDGHVPKIAGTDDFNLIEGNSSNSMSSFVASAATSAYRTGCNSAYQGGHTHSELLCTPRGDIGERAASPSASRLASLPTLHSLSVSPPRVLGKSTQPAVTHGVSNGVSSGVATDAAEVGATCSATRAATSAATSAAMGAMTAEATAEAIAEAPGKRRFPSRSDRRPGGRSADRPLLDAEGSAAPSAASSREGAETPPYYERHRGGVSSSLLARMGEVGLSERELLARTMGEYGLSLEEIQRALSEGRGETSGSTDRQAPSEREVVTVAMCELGLSLEEIRAALYDRSAPAPAVQIAVEAVI